jgi:hypothetical protein
MASQDKLGQQQKVMHTPVKRRSAKKVCSAGTFFKNAFRIKTNPAKIAVAINTLYAKEYSP